MMHVNKKRSGWVVSLLMVVGLMLCLSACAKNPDPYGDRTLETSNHTGPPRGGGQAP